MFDNTLTRDIGLKVGPTMFQVLVQHYFDHLKLDIEKSDSLKQDDVLYHEAFTIVKVSLFFPSIVPYLTYLKAFLNVSTL